jgi:hypothetical protein
MQQFNLIRIGLAVFALAAMVSSIARAADVSRACAASPYHVGDRLARYGPPGDKFYNSMHIQKIYVLFEPTRIAACCAPDRSPDYVHHIAGWLYALKGNPSGSMPEYTWYTRGDEMDHTLAFIYDPMTAIIIHDGHACP